MIRRLTLTELKLNLRDWSTTGFGLVLPVAILIALGSIPGVDEPDPCSAWLDAGHRSSGYRSLLLSTPARGETS